MRKISSNFTLSDIRAIRENIYDDQVARGLTLAEMATETALRGYQVAREWGLKVTIPDWVDQPGYPTSDGQLKTAN